MKSFPSLLRALICVIVFVTVGVLSAQPLPGLSSSGVDAALTRLFGENKAFSAEAVLKVYNANEIEILGTTMGFAVRDQQLRMDVDLSTLKTRHLPAGLADSLAQLGMENVVSLILPEQRASYLIYPGLESMLKVPMNESSLGVTADDFRLDRVAIGRETLGGQACIKYRVTVTDSSGATQEAITWNAPGLKDFPLQIQMIDGDNKMILRFRKLKLVEPSASLFALPESYTRYDSREGLMQAVMMKALGGLGTLTQP